MAGKEAIYFIIDVNSTMNHIVPQYNNTSSIGVCKQAIQLYLQYKLLFTKQDVCGVVLVGSMDTNNALSELDSTQYQHINHLIPLQKLSLNILHELHSIQCNTNTGHTEDGDVIDGIVVAMDSITKYCKKLKYTKRLFIFTNCQQYINDDIHGIKSIINGLVSEQYRINVIGFGFNDIDDGDDDGDGDTDNVRVKHEVDPDDPYSEIIIPAINTPNSISKSHQQIHNEQIIRYLCKYTSGQVFTPLNALSLLSEFQTRTVQQTSKLRGMLVFGVAGSDNAEDSIMNISVHTFAKTNEAKFPTMKKITAEQYNVLQGQQADRDRVEDEPMETGVLQERSYRAAHDADNNHNGSNESAGDIIDMSMTIKSFRYGKELIPVTDDEINTLMKYTTNKGISIIGFGQKSCIPRYTYMSTVDCIIAEPGNELAELAMSSLIHSLYELDKIMVVRYVKRANDRPLIGICTPCISNELECLYFNQLPYTQDIRDYTFHSFTNQSNVQYNQSQRSATRDLINQLDLMTSTVDEYGNTTESLKPELTFNPVLQHLYHNIYRRSINPNSAIQPLNHTIQSYIQPDHILQQRAHTAINNFRSQFKLIRSELNKHKRKSAGVIDWRFGDMNETVTHKLDYATIERAKKAKLDGDIHTYQQIINDSVTHVDINNPIDTFNIMISNHAITDKLLPIKQLINCIHNLIVLPGDTGLDLAYTCLVTLRTGCIQCSQYNIFNELLYELVKQYRNAKTKAKLIYKISDEQYRIVPITDEDVSGSTYNVDTAELFYDQFNLSQQASQQQQYSQLVSDYIHNSHNQ